MGTLQTCILGAQRAPLFIPSPALCHDVGNDCGHGTWPDRCVCSSVTETPQIWRITRTKHTPKHVTYVWRAPGPRLYSRSLILTVHKPVKQPCGVCLHVCQRFSCAGVRITKLSFQGVFPSPFISHLFLLHVTCLIIKFYFNPQSYASIYTPDTWPEGQLWGVTCSKRASGCC